MDQRGSSFPAPARYDSGDDSILRPCYPGLFKDRRGIAGVEVVSVVFADG